MPNLSDLLDSDMETSENFIDENSLISSVSDNTSIAQSRSAATRKKRKPVTMPKKSRVKTVVDQTNDRIPKPIATKRKMDDPVEEVEILEAAGQQTVKTKAKSEKSTKSNDSNSVVKRGRPAKKNTSVEDAELENHSQSPAFAQSSFAATKTSKSLPKPVKENQVKFGNKKPRKPAAPSVQDPVSDHEKDDDIPEEEPPKKKLRVENRPMQEPSYRRRGASVSDSERGDPMLRRKLGDVTRKYENIEIKYRNLKDAAVVEANANVEKLRKQCEAISEASNKLVSSLKKELALQAPMVQESRKLKKDIATRDAEAEKLKATNKDLNTSLIAAQNEIKNLQAKLAATRTTSTTSESKIPSSAIKTTTVTRVIGPPVTESAQLAQLKLDLYGDLTGLIIRNVKMEKDGDTYDCIQTGRNGTLHFKLYIDHEEAKNLSFEEVEFLYTPLLDANRDRDLIEIMPPYLSEDITFARENAAKFYARVVDTLTKKYDVVEEA